MSRRRSLVPSTRRGFLRGMGGVALALPFLEVFAPKKAFAATAPQRYVFMFGGMSIGSHGLDKMAPASEGILEGNLTTGLAPLGTYGVSHEVSLVSGLEIPVASTPPAGGRPFNFHSTSHQVIATGQRYDMDSFGALPAQSSDWIVANAIGAGTALPVLAYRAQPSFYRVGSEGTTDGRISARINGSGQLEQVTPIVSPHVAFQSLFGNFVVPGEEGSAEAERLLALRKSVVDLVADDTNALSKRLGKADRVRLERHFDELRSLETQLEAMELPGASACVKPDASLYANDPPIGDAVDPSGGGDYNDYYTNANGYSDENKRAELMTDLIHMAFACDISRVSSFMLTHAQCFMNMYTLLGHAERSARDQPRQHRWRHRGRDAGRARRLRRLARQALRAAGAEAARHRGRRRQLAARQHRARARVRGWLGLRSLETAATPARTRPRTWSCSSAARRAGSTPRPGRHIKAQGVHPSAVLNTLMQAVGVDETLGEVTGTVDELFG